MSNRGKDSSDWKLVDAHDIIVHIFHPEKREFYNLEKMWSEEMPKEKGHDMKKIITLSIFIFSFQIVLFFQK